MGNTYPIKTLIKEYGLISVGLIFYSFGFTTLLIPAQTIPSGSGGLASLIFYGLGSTQTGWLSIGSLYLMVNAVLLVIGLFIIGPKFGVKTVYAVLFNSVMMMIFERLPEGLLGLSTIEGDQLLMVILGGVFCGFGVALCFMQGGSSGGTDIIAMIVNKYHNISFGKVIMACDLIIIACSVIVFKGDLKPAIYGFVTMATVGYSLDLFLSGTKQSVQMFIFSSKYTEIGNKIINETKRGISYIDSTGGYTNQQRKIALVVCRKTEQSQIYRIIKNIDPNAFITSANVMGVFGNGFDALRSK